MLAELISVCAACKADRPEEFVDQAAGHFYDGGEPGTALAGRGLEPIQITADLGCAADEYAPIHEYPIVTDVPGAPALERLPKIEDEGRAIG